MTVIFAVLVQVVQKLDDIIQGIKYYGVNSVHGLFTVILFTG